MTTVRRVLLGAIAPLLIVAAYGLYTMDTPDPFFPAIPDIGARFQQLWLFSHLPSDVIPSLLNLFSGYLVASVFGIAAGVALGLVTSLGTLFKPVLDFGRSVPAIMLIPPMVLVLGVGDASKVAIIALGAFFPIVIATIDGLARTDRALLDVTRSMNLSVWKEIWVAWIPSAAPSIGGGMQTGLQFSLVLMIASEMLAATRGIGFLTMQAQITFDAPSVWAGIVLLAFIGFLTNALFVAIRNRVLRWNVAMRAATRSR